MEWILILWLSNGWAGSYATAEFNTKEACEFAGKSAESIAIAKGSERKAYICVPKGEKP